jgi:hypothetical protein
MTPKVPSSHERRARVDLPEWMRNPPPPKMTLRRRLSRYVESHPALRDIRRSWWRWCSRTRWAERHPVATAVFSFFFVLVTAIVAVNAMLYLFYLILTGQV